MIKTKSPIGNRCPLDFIFGESDERFTEIDPTLDIDKLWDADSPGSSIEIITELLETYRVGSFFIFTPGLIIFQKYQVGKIKELTDNKMKTAITELNNIEVTSQKPIYTISSNS